MARKLDVMYQGAFSYSIYIEESFAGLAAAVETLGLRERRALIVTDQHVAPLYLEEVRAALEKSGFTILSHEKSDDWSAFAAKK